MTSSSLLASFNLDLEFENTSADFVTSARDGMKGLKFLTSFITPSLFVVDALFDIKLVCDSSGLKAGFERKETKNVAPYVATISLVLSNLVLIWYRDHT